MVGLDRTRVELVSYNPEWREEYEDEVERLESVAGDHLVEYHHIGSTAVEGIPAKPIIDIMAVVDDLDSEKSDLIDLLEDNGYEHRHSEVPERIFFAKGPRENRTHYLSVTESESDFYEEKIGFRDYLRENSDVAEEYASLKRELAEKYTDNRDRYTEEKTDFIERVLEKTMD